MLMLFLFMSWIFHTGVYASHVFMVLLLIELIQVVVYMGFLTSLASLGWLHMSLLFLVLGAVEASMGLTLFVSMMRYYGSDLVSSQFAA